MNELTDAEWQEFQNIPEQGYSHRDWVNAKIKERVNAALAETETITPEPAGDAGLQYFATMRRMWGNDKDLMKHVDAAEKDYRQHRMKS